jgi:uncharacterized protein
MATWLCMKHCGACCHLDPGDRLDLETYLEPEELSEYLSLVGADGWCIHFDQTTRQCNIYDDRPDFCRVRPDTFSRMFGIDPEDLNDFAIQCCQEQIEAVYGDLSLESLRFDRETKLISQ